MNHFRRQKPMTTLACLLLCCFFLATGCTPYFQKKKSGPSAKTTGPMPVYYDFGDVLVPKELKIVKKESFLFKSGELSAGVLVLKGRVDRDSLIAFFENNMPKDGWSQLGSVKTPNTMLLFQKQGRWCMVEVLAHTFLTKVKIWVTTQEGSGLLKQ